MFGSLRDAKRIIPLRFAAVVQGYDTIIRCRIVQWRELDAGVEANMNDYYYHYHHYSIVVIIATINTCFQFGEGQFG